MSEELELVAQKLVQISEAEKECKENRAFLKQEFLDLIDEDNKGQDHLLPVITIEIPADFLTKVGLTEKEFLLSRFPAWDVEHSEMGEDVEVFILKKKPRYLPRVVEKDNLFNTIKVSKDVAEYNPEIDWDTLGKEFPNLVEAISVPVVTRELEEKKFEEELERNPELLSTLQRHMKVKQPVIRVTPRRIKKDG